MTEGTSDVRAADVAPPTRRETRKVLLATGIGHFVEWFEMGIYGTLATSIAANFFAPGTPPRRCSPRSRCSPSPSWSAPGGLFWGPLGDRIGRQKVLALIVLITSGRPSSSASCRPTPRSAPSPRCCSSSPGSSRASPPGASPPAPRPCCSSTPPRSARLPHQLDRHLRVPGLRRGLRTGPAADHGPGRRRHG
ncbi:hypothetical protein HFP72_01665 [Nocardiopsis sp. ARC36]